jgi:phosphatidylinositol-3-phosphatase
MRQKRHRVIGTFVCAGVLLGALAMGTFHVHADSAPGAIFVIALENHNWEQPVNKFNGAPQQIYQNPAAPYINSLVNGTSAISDQVSYATAYYHVEATPTGAKFSIHPSEPNYLWAEAGTNFGILNDNDPYSPNNTTSPPTFPNNHDTTQHLSAYLMKAGYTWKSYQEDVDLVPTGTGLVNRPATGTGGLKNVVSTPQSSWTVPLTSFSGTFASPDVNAYNGRNQYNFATKHNPQEFFTDTNGGNDRTSLNPLSLFYAPLQQLAIDLSNNTVANYNWITPNQFNDMHTALSITGTAPNTFNYKSVRDGTTWSGDAAQIRQGDDFLAQIIPTIMASAAYQNHGIIIIWTDETEKAGTGDTPSQNDFHHTLAEIVISHDAHPNVNGLPYASPVVYTHSSDLRTLQEMFGVGTAIRDAANANDLSDLFKPDLISSPSVNGNVTITAGHSMTFSNETVKGQIKVDGGTLFLSNGAQVTGNVQVSSGNVSIANSTVSGNVRFIGGGSFAIGAGAVINGNLQIQNLPESSDVMTVCGATVTGNVQFQNNGTPIAFGAQDVAGTSAACGNVIGGNMQIQENTASVQLFNNEVKKNLQCEDNSSLTGAGNTAKSLQGQCSAF